MWWAAQAIVENQLDCEETWRKHCAKAAPPGRTLRMEDVRRNLRINVHFNGPRPNLDDVKCLDSTERFVQNYLLDDAVIKAEIHEVAHKLVASCFYFERQGPGILDRASGVYRCNGNYDPVSPFRTQPLLLSKYKHWRMRLTILNLQVMSVAASPRAAMTSRVLAASFEAAFMAQRLCHTFICKRTTTRRSKRTTRCPFYRRISTTCASSASFSCRLS